MNNVSDVNVETIRAFLRVATTGNLTRAADSLNTSQPRMSRMIAALEAEIGVKLLKRTARGVVLSDAGRRFANRAPDILRDLDEAIDEATSGAPAPGGSVSIGIPHAMKIGRAHV